MKHSRTRTLACWIAAWVGLAAATSAFSADTLQMTDPEGDAVIRRSDWGNDAAVNPLVNRMPDLIQLRLGRFLPDQPSNDLFSGQWSDTAIFFRLDIVFDGLINPSGPVYWDDDDPQYDPMRYGPNPLCGYVELDLDGDVNTGGELDYPNDRYLGQVGRFGGVPSGSVFENRVALDRSCNDHNVQSPPFIDRSGEEFHLVFRAEEIDYIDVKSECTGGSPLVFEAGERWILHGDFFHRAHGFEDYAFSCQDRPGRYKPDVQIQFQHDLARDQTTVSLVYPLTNTASAQIANESPEPNDGCDDNHNSITEALLDLKWSANNASPIAMQQPEFQLISGWSDNVVFNHANPAGWRLTCLLGSVYATPQPGGDRFIWTDIWPNVVPGDFNGDGASNTQDAGVFGSYIAAHDGDPFYDADVSVNGEIECAGFARDFMVFDMNYDGVVNADDMPIGPIPGDMDLNNQVDINDVDDFALALTDPGFYPVKHEGESPVSRGDMNGDGLFDGADIPGFVDIVLVSGP